MASITVYYTRPGETTLANWSKTGNNCFWDVTNEDDSDMFYFSCDDSSLAIFSDSFVSLEVDGKNQIDIDAEAELAKKEEKRLADLAKKKVK